MTLTTVATEPTRITADLLTIAAELLPYVGRPVPLPSSDLHEALWRGALALGLADHAHAHRLADDAESLLTAYLVKAGKAEPWRYERCTLRGWLVRHDSAEIARELYGLARCLRSSPSENRTPARCVGPVAGGVLPEDSRRRDNGVSQPGGLDVRPSLTEGTR